MKISKKGVFIISLISFILLGITLLCFDYMGLASEVDLIEVQSNTTLIIPLKDEISKNGYPKNENGQTYGSDMGNQILESPDLMLAEGENGTLGYIYQPQGAASPGEVEEYYERRSNSTPLYLHDGKTVIGEFIFYTMK